MIDGLSFSVMCFGLPFQCDFSKLYLGCFYDYKVSNPNRLLFLKPFLSHWNWNKLFLPHRTFDQLVRYSSTKEDIISINSRNQFVFQIL